MTIVTPLRKSFEEIIIGRSFSPKIVAPTAKTWRSRWPLRFQERKPVLRPAPQTLEILVVACDDEDRRHHAVDEPDRADPEPKDCCHGYRGEHGAERGEARRQHGRQPDEGEREPGRPPQGEERAEVRRDAFPAAPAEERRPAVADDRRERGDGGGRAAERAGGEGGREAFERVEHEDRDRAALPERAQRVRRPDVPAPGAADVRSVERARDEHAERDRSDDERDERDRDEQPAVHASTSPGSSRRERNSNVSGTPSKSNSARSVFSMKRRYEAGTSSGSLT